MRIRCRNDHAAIAAVSLNGKPLAESAKVLIQSGTFQRPTGWKVEKIQLTLENGPTEAFRIMEYGEEPWRIRKIKAEVSVNNGTLKKAIPLDPNGLPLPTIRVTRQQGWITATLPPDALYLVLTP